MASAGISQEVADILREKHGFSFGDTGAFVSPTGAQVPIMLNEGGLVPGYKPGGYVDPVFAAVRANNEKARAEQEALEAYKASLATAGPTPLEIAQAGYAADQAAAAADPNRPGMMLGESGPFIAPGASDGPLPPQAPLAPTPSPVAPVAPAPAQVMDGGQPTFSPSAPLSPMVGTTQTPAPVQAAIPANTGPVGYPGSISSVAPAPVSEYMGTGSEQAGFNVAAANRAAFEAQQAAQAAAYQEEQAALKAASNIANAEYLSSPAYLDNQSTGPINVAEPITPAPAPVQTTEQLVAALDAAKDLSFSATNSSGYKGSRTSPVTGITYKGDKVAQEYELGPEYDNVVAVKRGNSVKLYKDGERVGFDAIGLKGVSGEGGSDKIVSLKNQLKNSQKEDVYEQFGGKDSELVSSYLAERAAYAADRKRIDEKKSDNFFGKIDTDINSTTFGQRTGGKMGALNKQVKTEAERLFPGDPNAVDKYYDLGNVERIKMAGRDIAEVFDPSLGPLFQNPDAMDPDNARSLGILAPTGAITSDPGPMPRPDDLFPTPVDGAGPTMIPDLVTPEGGRFGDLFPSLINTANAGTIENPQGLEFTQNQTTPYSELGMSPGAMGGALLGMSPGAMGGALPGEQVLAGTDDTSTMDAIMAGVNLDKEGSPPKDFIDRLALSESSGNYQSVNSLGYSGYLQFGQPRLDDYNNAFGTDITTKEFAADNDLQDKVNLWHIKDIDKTYDKLDPTALAAAGVDKDGFRAAAHIGGKTGATKFVNSLGAYNPSDANQTSIADYVQKFKKPEPVQTAGLNFSLSDLNPFRAASAATVPGDDDYEPIPYSELGGSPGAMGGELVPGQDFGGPSFTPDFDYVAPGMSPGAMGRMANPAVLAAEQNRLFQGAGDLFNNDLEYNIAGGLAEETGQGARGIAMTADEIAEEYAKQDPSLVYDTNNPRDILQRPLKVFSGYDPYEVDPSLIQALEGTNIPGYSGIADQGAAPTYERQNPDINVAKQFVYPTVIDPETGQTIKNPDRSGIGTYLEEVAEGLYAKISPGMKLRQEQALPEEGTTLTDVLSGDAKDRLGRTYGTDFVATAMTGSQEIGDLVVDGLILAITKNPALAFGTVATTSYGAAAQSASEQGRALVRAGLESGEIQKSKEYIAAVKEFGSEERAIKQLLDRVDEYSKTAGSVGALGDVVLAKFAGVLPGSKLVPKVVTRALPGSVKAAGTAVVQTGKALGSGGASSLTEATEGALANIGAQQAGSPVDIMTGTGADALLGYAGSTAGQTAVGLGQTVAGVATSAKNALSDEAIIKSATAPRTTVIPGAGPDIATDLNIQSPEAGVVNTTPFNVANLSKVSTPSGISTLAIPGQPGALPTNIDTTQPYTQTPNYLYGAGPTIKPSGISPGGVANVTAPAGDTAVNFPSSFSTLKTPGVDQEAMDVIAKVDDGGRPFVMTNNLLRILRNNNITADANTDPAEAIAALKVKASSAPSGVASLSTLGDPSNVTPPKPFVQAQQAIIQEIVETGGLSVKTANRLSNDLNMSMPEITRIAENAMGLDMSTPALPGPAPRTDMLPSGVSTLADTKGIGNLILNPPPVGKVPVRDKDTGKLTPAVINPVKTSIAADPNLLSMPTDTNIDITTDTDVAPAVATDVTTDVTTDVDTTTTVDVDDTITPLQTVDVPPEEPIEIEVDEPTAEDPINIVEEETDDDKPPFECPDGFTAVKVDGQFVCMPDEEEEDDGADTVIQKVRPRIASYYRPNTNAVLDNYTPYRPYGR